MEDDSLALGGNIELSGFRDLEPAESIVVKKIVGSYARTFSNKCKNLELLKITLKKVHEKEHSEKYEVHALVIDGGTQFAASATERNLFFALDGALKKAENEIDK